MDIYIFVIQMRYSHPTVNHAVANFSEKSNVSESKFVRVIFELLNFVF